VATQAIWTRSYKGRAFSVHAQALPNADRLRAVMLTVINDARSPVSVRNQCHLLMVAIERNNQTLLDECLVSLERTAKRTGYPLPSLGFGPDEPNG
jgi:hypothetical protein